MVDIVGKINKLGLPEGDFLVVGSGTIAALGLREPNDIDLLVTPSAYKQLKTAGWKEHTYPSTGDRGLTKDEFEVVVSWHGTRLEELVDSAVRFRGVPFANLEDVIGWKTTMARGKDLRDLDLIKKYQAGQLMATASPA